MSTDRSARFQELHTAGRILVLPNAWDAGSARLIESCGAEAIATTSSGVAWSCGYADGDHLPVKVLAEVVARIARVVRVPLSIDMEGGYSSDPAAVGENVAAIANAGAVGVNLEDGKSPPDLLCAKIEAAKRGAARAGIDLFVNARTDVFLKGLVPAEKAVDETIARARGYRDAGADGIFAPLASRPNDIRTLVAAIDLPLNVMMIPGLPTVAELRQLGVRRVSAGSALAQRAHGIVRQGVTSLLAQGTYDDLFPGAVPYPEMQALFV